MVEMSRHSMRQESLRLGSSSDSEMNGRNSRSRSSIQHNNVVDDDDDDDDDSLSGHSFGGDDEDDANSLSGNDFGEESNTISKNTAPPLRSMKSKRNGLQLTERSAQNTNRSNLERAKSRNTIGSGSGHSFSTGYRPSPSRLPWERKQTRLLRERRMLRENKKQEEIDLHYHFIGAVVNVSIAIFAMVFIIAIATTGGLCFKDESVTVFSFKQLEKCDACPEDGEVCEICDLPEGNQCYFPYY